MSLRFSDNFGGSSLNTSKWDTCYPWANSGAGCTNYGNPELEWYLPAQAQVSGNALHLVATQAATDGTTRAGQPTTYPWRSGMVTTFHSFEFTYGYVQVTARIPKGDGFWPTLWLLPQSEAWPPEIDFQESHDADTYSNSSTFHPVQGGQYQQVYTSPTDLSTGWHTYAVNWQPQSITWYVDGHTVFTHTGSDVPSEPMYFLANLAISGSEDPPSASTPPSASFDIQSVQIYQ
jgi:beta-glucanase (GH16 family)